VSRLRRAVRARRADERGIVAVYVAVLVPVLFALSAFAVDVARWYVELQRLQRAADAAALAAAPYTPVSRSTDAETAAGDQLVRNGYPAGAGVVSPGTRPTQVRVTVTNTVEANFAQMFGIDSITLSRSAVAEYNGPALMGSPCNTFGIEPAAGSLGPPGGSVLGTPFLRPCQAPPLFWATIQGPSTDKVHGDQFMTRVCGVRPDSSRPYGCSGNTNEEFNPIGYTYMLRVAGAAVGRSITLQLYDPAWVLSGANCEELPTNLVSASNPFTPDPGIRYDSVENEFCAGDYDPSQPGVPQSMPEGRVDTTFVVRAPVDTQDPLTAPVVGGCTRQFRGYDTPPTPEQLTDGDAAYDAELAQVFHQWHTLCTIPSAAPGDYYIQVRTNRRLPDTGPAIVSGSATAASRGDDAGAVGRGSNSFAMRAWVGTTGAVDKSASRNLSLAGWERMPMYMNASSGSAEFNLVRVPPAAAGTTVRIGVYDVGDAESGSGTVTVLPPVEANEDPQYAVGFAAAGGEYLIPGCIAEELNPGPLTSCSVGITNSVNNGRLQVVAVPVPTGYSCRTADGCWFRLRVQFPSGDVSDITTWTAITEDNLVRLTE
jgi:hypothetical protein